MLYNQYQDEHSAAPKVVKLGSGSEHEMQSCLQVLHSVQQALAFGEAFSGDDSPQLRAILAANTRDAFQSLVAADLAALCDVLAREPWKRSALSEGGEKAYHAYAAHTWGP